MERLNLRLPVTLLSLPHALLGVVLQLYAAHLGFDPIETTGLFWVFSALVLVIRLFSGRFTDRVGRRKAFLIACGFYTLSYVLYSIAASLPMLYLARIVQAFGAALFITACYSMIGDVSSNDFGKNFGAFSGYRNRGGLYGMAVSGVSFAGVSFAAGWSRMFAIFAVAGVAATLMAFRKIPETGKGITTDQPKVELPPEKRRVLWLYLITCIANSMVNVVLVMYLGARFQPRFEQVAFTFISAIAIVAFVIPKAGRMIDAIGSSKAMVGSLMLSAASLLLLAFSNSLVMFGALWTGYSMAVAVLVTSIDAMYSHGIDDANRSGMMSRYISISDAGAMVGSALTGLLFKSAGIYAPFIAAALLFAILYAVSRVYMWHNTKISKEC